MDRTLWSVADVARYLNVKPQTVYRLYWKKAFRGVKIGAAVRFDPAEIRSWARGRRRVHRTLEERDEES